MEVAKNNGNGTSSRTKDFFTRDDLKGLLDWKLGEDYLKIICGCTSNMGFGDFVGTLRITREGEISIVCDCIPGQCNKGPMSPHEFENHGRNGWRKWRESIWVTMYDTEDEIYTKKVPLSNTVLLRYHHSAKVHNSLVVHRDEFVRCSSCGKERRFKRRNREECRVYYEAVSKRKWVCGDLPSGGMGCETEEEREARKAARGCPRLLKCPGCLSCTCTGCAMCIVG